MTDDKIDELHKKYPIILQELHGDPSKTCMSDMHGGIACGNGWYDLLDGLFNWCQWQADKNYYPQIVAEQIKEKFGTLRFYYRLEENSEIEELKRNSSRPEYAERSSDYIRGAVSFAESMSAKTCERCGQPGKVRGARWRTCVCDECAPQYNIT